jgi:hypothetical protein
VVTTSIVTVAFRWPSASTAQLVALIGYIADEAPHTRVPWCTFGGKHAKTAKFNPIRSLRILVYKQKVAVLTIDQ